MNTSEKEKPFTLLNSSYTDITYDTYIDDLILLQINLNKKIVLSLKAQHLTIYTLRLQDINLKSLLFLYKLYKIYSCSGGTYSNRSSTLQSNAQHKRARTAISSLVTSPLQY